MTKRALLVVLLFSLAATLTAQNTPRRRSVRHPGPPFEYVIDATVKPMAQEASHPPGSPARPLAAMREPNAMETSFVVDEVVLTPANDQQLAQFLQRHSGTVADPGVTLTRRNAQGQPITVPRSAGFVVVRVDLTTGDLASFVRNADQTGASGAHRVSSSDAARLLSIIAAERISGLFLGINPISTTARATKSCAFKTTFEHPATTLAPDLKMPNAGYRDGFGFKWLNDPDIQVAAAWQHIASSGPANEIVYLFVIDGGFSPNSDFRSDPSGAGTQANFTVKASDPAAYDATGTNPNICTGGSVCRWHGTQVMSTAGAVLDNRFGAAGTGGQVVVPVLFKVDGSQSQTVSAVKSAIDWAGSTPAVINMSFWGSCGFWCYEAPMRDSVNEAASKGITPVAIAGNDSTSTKVIDVGDAAIRPCKYSGAICVGAIDTKRNRAEYSNAGKKVEIWAPGEDVVTTPDPDSGGALTSFGGTSAAAPFVAGVIAMMKAVNPFLTRAEILSILQTTASKSTDPRVSPGFVNALLAVRKASSASLVSTHFEGTGVIWHDSFGFFDEYVDIGDFNGDCRDDLVTFTKGSEGRVFVALAAGSTFVGSGEMWRDGFCLGDEVCAVGDFDGDGRDDLASFNQSTGNVKVSRSTGTGFAAPALWQASFSKRPGQTIRVANFNFTATPVEEKDDIAVFVHGNDPATLASGESRGEVYVSLSNGSSFGSRSRWHDFFAPGPESVAAADVDGDGRADVIAFLQDCCPEPDRADVYVAKSIGSSFRASEKWSEFFSLGGQIAGAGSFSGNGSGDIITFVHDRPDETKGDVYVDRSLSGAFVSGGKWHEHFCIGSEICRTGDFNGDGRRDVAAFTRGGTGDVFIALSRP